MDVKDAQSRLKECREILADERNAKQSIPQIPPKIITEISSLVDFPNKNDFIKRLVSYWKLKRIQRNCVPLL